MFRIRDHFAFLLVLTCQQGFAVKRAIKMSIWCLSVVATCFLLNASQSNAAVRTYNLTIHRGYNAPGMSKIMARLGGVH